ncbi:MAG: 4Fe-4S dicluster domain-containing protein [Candidatus Eisenbacteria bacterium]
MNDAGQSGQQRTLERGDLDRLIESLRERGYAVIGPVVRDGAIVHEPITSTADLPEGWSDEQEAATYRLHRHGGPALFDFTVGPSSWKRFLLPPRVQLWRVRQDGQSAEMNGGAEPRPPFAFFGVRSCELHAIAIQDRVFLGGAIQDPVYRERREAAFIVVVQCGRAGRTCFCASMSTGPRASAGFDLAVTEVVEDGRHYFVAESGSARGAELLAMLPQLPSSTAEIGAAGRATTRALEQMGRRLQTKGLPELLAASHEHPRWDDVARRCLTCGNCTMVCPTCFCTTVEDHLELGGAAAERVRRWDSCFTSEFSYIHGGSVRHSGRAKYRQWLTHKLGTWHQQFGTSGCVGCGRCIAWCPAAIDLTEEVSALSKSGRGKERDGGTT